MSDTAGPAGRRAGDVAPPAALRSLDEARLVQLPRISDPRGNLTYLESRRNVPFEVRRAYWLYEVPGGEERGGGHAYRTNEEFVVALSGSFAVTIDDGTDSREFTLNRGYFGLHVPATLWRRIHDFSTNSVCLVLSSRPYDVDEYIRDHELFVRWRGREVAG